MRFRGWLAAEDGRVPWWQTGNGPDVLYVPGLEDGLLSGRGLELALGWLTRQFLPGGLRVTAVGRREVVPPEYTTRQMAADIAAGLEAAGLQPAAVVGAGVGALVAWWLAADFPDLCPALVTLGASPEGAAPAALADLLEEMRQVLRYRSWEEALDRVAGLYLPPPLEVHSRALLVLARRLGRPREAERLLRQLAAFRRHRPPPALPEGAAVLAVACMQDAFASVPRTLDRLRADVCGRGPVRWVLLAGDQRALLRQRTVVQAEVRRFLMERAEVPGTLSAAR